MYKNKIRTLYVNLKDKNNPGLRENVVSGNLSVSRFCTMSSQVSPCIISPSSKKVYLTLLDGSVRKWHLKRGRRRTTRSRRIIFSRHWEQENNRPRQMHSSVPDANRFGWSSSLRFFEKEITRNYPAEMSISAGANSECRWTDDCKCHHFVFGHLFSVLIYYSLQTFVTCVSIFYSCVFFRSFINPVLLQMYGL